jgi:amino acid transporter
MVSVDAVLVLSGAVLTAYVGVTGLIRRMALDRCLPQFLLKENEIRRTNHWIILVFFGLCCSIVFITAGDIDTLAGVYSPSFLGVMALFALGNMLLKVKRRRLPRAVKASWAAVVVAFVMVVIGWLANAFGEWPRIDRLVVFFMYALVAVGVVTISFNRAPVLKMRLATTQANVRCTGLRARIFSPGPGSRR